ncbi:MAG: mercuric reductase [Anaerolineae bacterium]|nr:mercuric reductase [Anaerolineae bacterium]
MQYDAIIIGAGQAGPGLAHSLAGNSEKVAMIEGNLVGGSCINYGCTPSKALRACADVAHLARRAADFGVKTGPVTVDFQAVVQRTQEIVTQKRQGLRDGLVEAKNIDFYHAYAHFEPKQGELFHVRAGDDLLEAKRVYLNTGTRASIPPIDGLKDIPYLTNQEIMDMPERPKQLLIIGGGYIAVETGQMYQRFGSEVTLIERESSILQQEDPDIIDTISGFLQDEGITIYTNATARHVEKSADGGVKLTITHGDGEKVVSGSHLLLATGRIPNTDHLNLDAVGIETDEKGHIRTNDRLETNVPGVWAMGDINGRGAFTHTSYQDYEIVWANYQGKPRSVADRIMTYNVYCDPPLGRVGMNEQQARESGKKVLQGVLPMSSVSRAGLEGQTIGMIKLLVDADSEQFLGASILGLHADEVIQVISNFMHTGASYKVMQKALPIHPTVAELLPTTLGKLEPLG